MGQLWKIRLPDGRVLEPGDWTSAEPLYSTVEVAAGTIQPLVAFSFGIGGVVPGSINQRTAFLTDTNLEGEGGKIPENEELVVYNLHVEAYQIGTKSTTDASGMPTSDPPQVSLADMLRLQRDLVIVTRIAAVKRYTQAPLSYFPAGMGVNRYTSAARNAGADVANGAVIATNGGVNVADGRTFASPLYAGPGDVFGIEVIPAPGSVENLSLVSTSRIRLRLFCEGYRRRPVA